jgi:hypothetical protein
MSPWHFCTGLAHVYVSGDELDDRLIVSNNNRFLQGWGGPLSLHIVTERPVYRLALQPRMCDVDSAISYQNKLLAYSQLASARHWRARIVLGNKARPLPPASFLIIF